MRSAQFVKGKIFDSEKQDSYEQTFESPTLETFLPYEKLAKLRSIKIITDQPQQRYFRTEHVFALFHACPRSRIRFVAFRTDPCNRVTHFYIDSMID